ncbi:hypothetical protein U14_00288 [Candidatus Moduliflexus flocculans]|uniref:Uncharacterized protein n=1 Tax=Candidatus Moduliflexus flocculans TaxID=1499966 RepID=A0A0S6VWG8_9BACT|nr:hypothetical protein U14_00288 [Candidatus Moduliflexus flocculans]
MIAIRQIQDVTSEMITVRIPKNFPSKRAEIIILPVEEFSANEQETMLQIVLLNAPTICEDELAGFEHVREWMNTWNVKEF